MILLLMIIMLMILMMMLMMMMKMMMILLMMMLIMIIMMMIILMTMIMIIMIMIIMMMTMMMKMIMMVSYRSYRGRPEPDQSLRSAVGPAHPGLHEGRANGHLPREEQERSRHEERPARHIQGRCRSSGRLCSIQNSVKLNYAFFLSRQNHI